MKKGYVKWEKNQFNFKDEIYLKMRFVYNMKVFELCYYILSVFFLPKWSYQRNYVQQKIHQ